MAILNNNTVVLRDSGLSLENTIIIGHNFSGVTKLGLAIISMQIGFYADVEKWVSNPQDRLIVTGFDKSKRVLAFEFPAGTEENVFYFFDLKLKDYLISCFPEWDPDKLVITTAPQE